MALKQKHRVLTAFIVATFTIFIMSCGRGYDIKGRVVFLSQLESSDGIIAEITGQQIPSGGKPIEGAKVRMFHQIKDGKPSEGSVWEQDSLTDADGYFEISDYAAPYDNVPVGLEVSKDGYKTVRTIYIDYLDAERDKSEKTQIFFVVLSQSVPDK
jgi:hypothetical protein